MKYSVCDVLYGDNQKKCFDANEFVRKNKKLLIQTFADILKYPPDGAPVTVFMAGSPGAGKTEFSKRLISELKGRGAIERDPVRIDPDEIRGILPGYTGNNSYVFQAACAIAVDKLYDHVLSKGQSAIIDGTFSSEKSIHNIERSIAKNRLVEIFYLYQDPKVAWEFTKKREALEGRNIPKEAFIEAFFESKVNVNRAKMMFKDKVRVNLIIKDFQTGFEELKLNIDKVDHYLSVPYTRDDLEKLII